MPAGRPISDRTIFTICSTIGLLSLVFNVFALILTKRMWNVSSRKIVVVSMLMQVFYIIQNFHYTVLFIPFFYIPIAGGYCIGHLCEPHYVPFNVHLLICVFLVTNLWAQFIVLLFYRHQSLLRPTSRVKLSDSSVKVITFLLVAGINILPFTHEYGHYTATSGEWNNTFHNYCKSCGWVEQNRNFDGLPAKNAIISAYIIAITCTVYLTFAFACTIHICVIINEYDKMRSSGNFATKVSRTKQSLVQFATFTAVLAAPIALFMSLAVVEFEDDSIVQLPSILLFSLNSFSHSFLTIIHSPFIKKYLHKTISQIGNERTSFNASKATVNAHPSFIK